ncbi:MAG: enoyl-CoA hydratase/isomerase family protein [Labilithrix sp.]|nr:enoyl-CoA hydratase/isomerase family protein [Labilithrix sp.]
MSAKTKPPTRLYARIRVADEVPVTTITLFNPERRNAIGPQMVNELLYAIADAHADDDVRAIVITGDGKAFCAGGDFAQMTGGASEGPALPPKGDYADLLLAMARTEKPIVARVNGPAMGGGLGIVAASTFAVAERGAILGTPEINVGLFPMMIMAVLARIVPRRKLLEMMLFGQKLTADQALAAGLLNEVVAPEELDAAVEKITGEIVKKSPSTVALGLRAFAAQDDMDLEEALPMLRDRLAECLATDDAREGLMAFLEKRPPVWKGK